MRQPTLTRLLAIALLASLGLAAVGGAWELARFGFSEASSIARLESDVRGQVRRAGATVEALANRVAGIGPLVEDGIASHDKLPALFDRLAELTRPAVDGGASLTLYERGGPREFRVIAWTAGPSDDVAPERLSETSDTPFVAQGSAGVRLAFVRSIETEGRRVAVAVAETLLAPATVGAVAQSAQLDTAYGPVTAVPPYAGAGAFAGADRSDAFVIEDGRGATLLEIGFSRAELTGQRQRFRRRVIAVALLPWLTVVLLLTGPVRDGRFRPELPTGWRAAMVAGVMVLAAAAGAWGLLRLVEAPRVWDLVVVGLTALGLIALFPVASWWHSASRRSRVGRRGRFMAEQLAAGGVVAAALVLTCLVVAAAAAQAPDGNASPLFTFSLEGLAGYCGLLMVQIAAAWGVASLLAGRALRWRLTWRRPSFSALVLWIGPTAAVLLMARDRLPLPVASVAAAAAGAAVFALWSADVRRLYRHTSQAMRLVLSLAAMVLPALLLAQLFTFYGERRTVASIETALAPAIANHALDLRDLLRQTQDEVDRLAGLPDFVLMPDPSSNRVTIDGAFAVWRQTNLSVSRPTSEVELFARSPLDGELRLASRFGLNVPELEYGEGEGTWEGQGCEWESYEKLKRVGGTDRRMLRAERGICEPDGTVVGAVVLQLLPDYQSLPFIASANTYYGLLSQESRASAAGRNLAVVVYGWGLNPLFVSSRVAWPIGGDLYDRLYQSRESFWTTLSADNGDYRVFFRSDRAGIYAVGYLVPSWFDVSTGLAETTAITTGLFVVFLLAAAVYGPFARRRDAPLPALFNEIRTSFYRKLFLFFVLAAIGPVFLLTLAFRTYMSTTFNADVESEAADVVTVAQQVLEQLSAAVQHPDEPQQVPSDDMMVLIRQMIDQDVNLYVGPDLAATSQRDLFRSGLLPTRTPVAAYRAVALDRLPSDVAEDRLGSLEYLIAAAPLPLLRQDAVLTVPLAIRQREIEDHLETLNRGVLVGAMLVVLFAAGLGASVAARISDPVARLSRATRQIAAGDLDVRIAVDTADELRRLVDDFNTMTARLVAQRAELARSQQLKAWSEMARQVAHEIKNPLTPVQLAAEHLERVHEDRGRPLGEPFEQCLSTIFSQVRILRTIASEFSNFAGTPTPHPAAEDLAALLDEVIGAYRVSPAIAVEVVVSAGLPPVWIDRTLAARALVNLVENAMQAMPDGGTLRVAARRAGDMAVVTLADSGVGMEAAAAERAFEPYFSTKTAGSGLGLANAKRNVELCGGDVTLQSAPGRGTTVTVTLPLAQPPVEGAAD